MEPKLRRAGGSGTGTGTPFSPFNPFAADNEVGDSKAGEASPEPGDETGIAPDSAPAADFNKGARRGRRRAGPPTG
jgi:hypothetical protein